MGILVWIGITLVLIEVLGTVLGAFVAAFLLMADAIGGWLKRRSPDDSGSRVVAGSMTEQSLPSGQGQGYFATDNTGRWESTWPLYLPGESHKWPE